jgi:hypothetical protein
LHTHTYKHVSTIIPMKVILQHQHNIGNNYIHTDTSTNVTANSLLAKIKLVDDTRQKNRRATLIRRKVTILQYKLHTTQLLKYILKHINNEYLTFQK